MEKYMSTSEVMEYMCISKSTLYRYISKGLPVIKVSAKKCLYERKEIDRWIKEKQ